MLLPQTGSYKLERFMLKFTIIDKYLIIGIGQMLPANSRPHVISSGEY